MLPYLVYYNNSAKASNLMSPFIEQDLDDEHKLFDPYNTSKFLYSPPALVSEPLEEREDSGLVSEISSTGVIGGVAMAKTLSLKDSTHFALKALKDGANASFMVDSTTSNTTTLQSTPSSASTTFDLLDGGFERLSLAPSASNGPMTIPIGAGSAFQSRNASSNGHSRAGSGSASAKFPSLYASEVVSNSTPSTSGGFYGNNTGLSSYSSLGGFDGASAYNSASTMRNENSSLLNSYGNNNHGYMGFENSNAAFPLSSGPSHLSSFDANGSLGLGGYGGQQLQGQHQSSHQYQEYYQQGGYAQASQLTPLGMPYGMQHPGGIDPSKRTLYFGNLPTGCTFEQLLDCISGGMIENAKMLQDRQCAFVTFLEAECAYRVLANLTAGPHSLVIAGNEIRIGWGNPSQVSPSILAAVSQGASRNIWLGNTTLSAAEIEVEFCQFGPVDTISTFPEKKVAFVHLASISAAIQAVHYFCVEPAWEGVRIYYGKDRCQGNGEARPLMNMSSIPVISAASIPNRTIYIGGIHPEATTKDLCDAIRGGILQNIKYMSLKNIAFVMFICPIAAQSFYDRISAEGLSIKSKRCKIGWGKPQPIAPLISHIVSLGGSRNVYIGGLHTPDPDKLRQDFSPFGEIELINIVPERNIAFVNYTDISFAIKAVEAMKNHRDYVRFKINYGKDRCGNPPRPKMDASYLPELELSVTDVSRLEY